ncbi:MAG: GNAT family N-acetyltransferase [Candidatus Promineifilaceae bacterium]|nr:GNAT family N-acetyltransferase [Candidatus Promineifilaceae bacterium]
MSANGFWVFQQGVLWAVDVGDSDLPPPVEPRMAARFAECGPEDGRALAQAMGRDDVQGIERQLRGARRCFAAWVGEEIASYCWLSVGEEEVGEMERTINLPAGEGYIWNCATLPRFRRQRLYTALLNFMIRRLADEAFRRVWVGANRENRPSLSAFDTAGFRPAAVMTYARLFWLSVLYVSAGSGAPDDLVDAARNLFRMAEEGQLGPFIVGWRHGASG